MTEALLEIKDLETHFIGEGDRVKAVDRISLSVQPGEVVGLVGESGSRWLWAGCLHLRARLCWRAMI